MRLAILNSLIGDKPADWRVYLMELHDGRYQRKRILVKNGYF
jgi:hypothetical protein